MRNVMDQYQNLSVEEIKEEREQNTLPFAVCMMHIRLDFNMGTVVRNSNAFGASEVFYFGPTKRWDRRGAVGAHHYMDVSHIHIIQDYSRISSLREKYPHWVALDNPEDSPTINIHEFQWKPGTLLFLGEEGCGLPPEILHACDAIVKIPQRGTVRSLNVGTASGIAMYLLERSLRSS